LCFTKVNVNRIFLGEALLVRIRHGTPPLAELLADVTERHLRVRAHYILALGLYELHVPGECPARSLALLLLTHGSAALLALVLALLLRLPRALLASTTLIL